ncbi:MAG: hypothetical protein V1753_12245 [Pseudomonadota bacterium]
MLRLFRNKKAQAATEIAIIGSLIIMVFSYLLVYSVKLRKRQLYIQRAFRLAIAEAKAAGTATAEVSVYKRMPNVTDPYVPGEKANFGGGAAILWSKSAQGTDSEIKESSGTPDDSGSYTKTLTRIETPGSLTRTTLKMNGTEVFSSE